MRYVVHGMREQIVSVEVEADSKAEALELAGNGDTRDIDVWDTDYYWHIAFEQ